MALREWRESRAIDHDLARHVSRRCWPCKGSQHLPGPTQEGRRSCNGFPDKHRQAAWASWLGELARPPRYLPTYGDNRQLGSGLGREGPLAGCQADSLQPDWEAVGWNPSVQINARFGETTPSSRSKEARALGMFRSRSGLPSTSPCPHTQSRPKRVAENSFFFMYYIELNIDLIMELNFWIVATTQVFLSTPHRDRGTFIGKGALGCCCTLGYAKPCRTPLYKVPDRRTTKFRRLWRLGGSAEMRG